LCLLCVCIYGVEVCDVCDGGGVIAAMMTRFDFM
jgi:hypothetical protein